MHGSQLPRGPPGVALHTHPLEHSELSVQPTEILYKMRKTLFGWKFERLSEFAAVLRVAFIF
jgi:hypothetical protein